MEHDDMVFNIKNLFFSDTRETIFTFKNGAVYSGAFYKAKVQPDLTVLLVIHVYLEIVEKNDYSPSLLMKDI